MDTVLALLVIPVSVAAFCGVMLLYLWALGAPVRQRRKERERQWRDWPTGGTYHP